MSVFVVSINLWGISDLIFVQIKDIYNDGICD